MLQWTKQADGSYTATAKGHQLKIEKDSWMPSRTWKTRMDGVVFSAYPSLKMAKAAFESAFSGRA